MLWVSHAHAFRRLARLPFIDDSTIYANSVPLLAFREVFSFVDTPRHAG